jgi:kumamolisin
MTSTPTDLNKQLTITILVQRPTYNGMTVKDHADGVIAGTHPVLDHTEFETMFGACDSDIDEVVQYVKQAGLTITYSHCCAASVIAVGTVGQINSAFGITLTDITTPDRTYMTYSGSIVVPDDLKDIIKYIDGIDNSFHVAPGAPVPTPASTPTPGYNTGLVMPQKAATAYGFPGNNDGSDGVGQVIGLIEPFGNGGYTLQNLNSTYTTYGISGTTVVPYELNDCKNDPTLGEPITNSEIMLDIAMVAGIVPKSTIIVYICISYITALTAILNDPKNIGYKPKIVSISAGGPEPSGLYGSIVDGLLAEAVSRGVTIIACSGDWGAYNLPINRTERKYGACFPASSPYVLAVGGTSLKLNSDGSINSEITWNNNGEDYHITGGNQSTRYPVPTWQSGITLKNYATGLSSAPTGRAVPDVALVGDPYTGFTFNYYYSASLPNRQRTDGGGTSAAAPLWAGLIARINELIGKPCGFVNDKFYANTGAFNDILPTSVANNNAYLGVGFSTTTGWDACTGWGSPKGQSVYNLFRKLNAIQVKTGNTTWSSVQNIKVKTGDKTWSPVTKVWTKTGPTTWTQIY